MNKNEIIQKINLNFLNLNKRELMSVLNYSTQRLELQKTSPLFKNKQ